MKELVYSLKKTTPYPLGLKRTDNGLRLSMVSETDNCGIQFWTRESDEKQFVKLDKTCKCGSVYAAEIIGDFPKELIYQLFQDELTYPDPYALASFGKRELGKKAEQYSMLTAVSEEPDDDVKPAIPYADKVFYMLHARGFTMQKDAKTASKGTFKGIEEKLDYVKELGVTSLLLMPVYDFDEFLRKHNKKMTIREEIETYKIDYKKVGKEKEKINFWGYTAQNGYYLPKSAFSESESAVDEFKSMIKKAHKMGLEIFMQMYFPKEILTREVSDILLYWSENYHVDGFYLIGEGVNADQLLMDPALSDVHLMFEHADEELMKKHDNAVVVSDQFMFDMRSFLKGDSNLVPSVTRHVRQQKKEVHFIAKQDTMRLMDMVSYQEKHNLDNGENNADGTDYNCSWNCGVEGKTRKKQILTLRMKQMKNAMSLLLLSQGTPLIYGGDEFGHTQLGNNNPYCQDNEISYLRWSDLEKNKELYEYTKKLLKIRKQYPVLHGLVDFKGTDYMSCGFPDISFHSEEAWRNEGGSGSHLFGVMYANCYASKEDKSLLYVAYNMHWEKHDFALPKAPKGMKWECVLSTDEKETVKEIGAKVTVPERTVMIFTAK